MFLHQWVATAMIYNPTNSHLDKCIRHSFSILTSRKNLKCNGGSALKPIINANDVQLIYDSAITNNPILQSYL